MKSQDILILLKLVCLEKPEYNRPVSADDYSVRGLEAALGVSKTEVNASINRSLDVGLASRDRNSGLPRVNRKALLEFVVHGVKYVFPARPEALARGIPTGFAAPPLKSELMSAAEYDFVWPDPKGKVMGQSIKPLFKSVSQVAKQDECLYMLLALVDAIRLGNPREANLAAKLFEEELQD